MASPTFEARQWVWFPHNAAVYHAVLIITISMSVHYVPVAPLLIPLAIVAAYILSTNYSFRPIDYLTTFMPVMFYAGVGVTTNISAADFLVPMVAVLSIVGAHASLKSPNSSTAVRIFWFAGTLLLVAMASMIQGQLTSMGDNYLVIAGFELAKLAVCVVYAMVYALEGLRSANNGDLRTVQVWAWSAVVLTFASFVGLVVPLWGFVPYAGTRTRGAFEDPNLFAMYLLIALSLACLYNYVRYQNYIRFNVVLLVIGVASTASRSGLIALVVILCLLGILELIFHSRIDLRLIVSGFVFAVSFPLWSNASAIARVAGASELEEDKRVGLWKISWELWREHPFTGLGFGNLQYVVQQITGATSGQLAHNSYLTFLSETGLFGGILFTGGVAAIVLVAFRYASLGPAGICSFMAMVAIAVELTALNAHNVRFAWAAIAYLLALGVPLVCQIDNPRPVRR